MKSARSGLGRTVLGIGIAGLAIFGITKLVSTRGGFNVRYAGPDPALEKREHAVALAAKSDARIVGVHQTADGVWHVMPFADGWKAASWFVDVTNGYAPYQGTFAVWFDKDTSSWPYPSNEMDGDDPDPVEQARRQAIRGERAFTAQLRVMPGYVYAGPAALNPEEPQEKWIVGYVVRWLRGQPVPVLPSMIGNRKIKLEIVDSPVPIDPPQG